MVSTGVKIPTLPQENEAPSQIMCPACGLINKISSTKGLDLVKCSICGCEIEL